LLLLLLGLLGLLNKHSLVAPGGPLPLLLLWRLLWLRRHRQTTNSALQLLLLLWSWLCLLLLRLCLLLLLQCHCVPDRPGRRLLLLLLCARVALLPRWGCLLPQLLLLLLR
jgi:hypothetical protein